MFQRVPSNTNTRTHSPEHNSPMAFPTKIREFGESQSFSETFLFLHWSVNVLVPQIVLPKMRNWNTGVSRHGSKFLIKCHTSGVTLGRYITAFLDVVNYLVFRPVHVCVF